MIPLKTPEKASILRCFQGDQKGRLEYFNKLGINKHEPRADPILSGKVNENTTMTHIKNAAVLLFLWIYLPARIKG